MSWSRRATPPPWAARILVADDDAEMRSFVSDVLRDEGCAVVDTCDGVEAARRLFIDDDQWQYELVITDQRMPGLTGLDLARRLRSPESPPVILMSAFLDGELEAYAKLMGVAAVLPKPFAIGQLVGAVRSLIGPL